MSAHFCQSSMQKCQHEFFPQGIGSHRKASENSQRKIAGQKIPGWEILGAENEMSISSKHQSNLIYVLLGI